MFYEIIISLIRRFIDRNHRKILRTKNGILSPADGKIIYIKKIEGSNLFYNDKIINASEIINSQKIKYSYQYAIAIYMSPFDVHINRSPINGAVEKIIYKKGRLFRTTNKHSELRNERNYIIIKNKKFRVAVIQIAAKFFGKIICNVKEGERVRIGYPLGMITLGSQVNILLPQIKNLRINVKEGKKVYAGISKLASF